MLSIVRGLKIRQQKPENTGQRCCVVGCSNRSGTDKVNNIKRSYHSFPSEERRRKLWVQAIPRTNWTPGKYDKVCSDHFVGGRASCWQDTPGYVPSLFPTKPVPLERTTNTAKRAGIHLETPPPKTPRKKKREVHDNEAIWQMTGHDYLKTTQCSLPVDVEVVQLNKKIVVLEAENDQLKRRVLCISSIKDDERLFLFYTGIPNYACFEGLLNYLYKRCQGNLNYWRGAANSNFAYFSESSRKPGPARKLEFQNELFLTLVKLRTGKFSVDLARELDISETLVSRIVTTWVNFLAIELKLLFEMRVNLDDEDMIAPCYRNYESLKLVIDCTELVSERSTSIQARKETFSNYKSRDTVKFMVGLSPNLTVNFVSMAYGGRASDKFITLNSRDMLDNLDVGSEVMADRGFKVTKELENLGVKLIIPDFKGRDRSQMSVDEVQNSEEIAKARIHIERVIQRIRSFHILDSTVKLCQKDVIEQIFTVCAYLVNFQTPIKDTSAMQDTENLFEEKSVIEMITQESVSFN